MKENNTVDIQILSNRARDFLNSPRHQKVSTEHYLTTRWNFSIDPSSEDFQNDKILTLNYFITSEEKDLEKLLYESLSRMTLERTVSFLLKLQFRELENFLRNENHLPVFLESEQVLAMECFNKVKNSLLAALIYKKIEKFIGVMKLWSEYNLVEKNAQIKRLILLINNLFSPMKILELVLASSEEINIVLSNSPIDSEAIQMLFQWCFGETFEKTSFKVVAVQ